MVAGASEFFFKWNYEFETQEQIERRDQFFKPKTGPLKMTTLQATAVLKNIENKLEGLQVTVEKNLVNVKPMSDLSNWDTTGYETYLKNPAQELQENIKDEGARTKDEGVRTKGVYLKILGATFRRREHDELQRRIYEVASLRDSPTNWAHYHQLRRGFHHLQAEPG